MMRRISFFEAIAIGFMKLFGVADGQHIWVGELEHKQWNKSIESYCAGGSDYFILKTKDGGTFVLENPSQYSPEQLAKWSGKQVKVWGELLDKEIAPPDPMSQQPIHSPIGSTPEPTHCTVLKIEKMRKR